MGIGNYTSPPIVRELFLYSIYCTGDRRSPENLKHP